jgi:hypothetical protein
LQTALRYMENFAEKRALRRSIYPTSVN